MNESKNGRATCCVATDLQAVLKVIKFPEDQEEQARKLMCARLDLRPLLILPTFVSSASLYHAADISQKVRHCQERRGQVGRLGRSTFSFFIYSPSCDDRNSVCIPDGDCQIIWQGQVINDDSRGQVNEMVVGLTPTIPQMLKDGVDPTISQAIVVDLLEPLGIRQIILR